MHGPLSTFAFVALCVGIYVLSAREAPFSTSLGIDMQRRDFINLVWMNTAVLPPNSNNTPDIYDYEYFSNSVGDDVILSVLQGAFNNLINDGISHVEAPAEGQNSVSIDDTSVSNTAAEISVVVQSITVLDFKEEALTQWFNVAQEDSVDTALNLATWSQNAMKSANVVELCGEPYYNNYDSWGAILIQLTSAVPTSFTTAELQSKFVACLNADY